MKCAFRGTNGVGGRFCLVFIVLCGAGIRGPVRGSVRGVSAKRFGALMDC